MSAELDWAGLRRTLQALTREVGEEIRAYPAPIPACDAQFNHLLELRRLLPQELARLEMAATDPAASVEEFIRSSPCGAELSAWGAIGVGRISPKFPDRGVENICRFKRLMPSGQ